MQLEYFSAASGAIAYIQDEIVATLEEDLSRMERDERRHYTDEDRAEMRARINDVQLVIANCPWIALP